MQLQHVHAIARALLLLVALSLAAPLMHAGAQSAANDDLEPGMTAAVYADGDCLRLRAEPGADGDQLGCIPDGALLTVQDGTQQLDGYQWRSVEWNGLTGWVADAFLRPADAEPERGSCSLGSGSVASETSAGFTGLYAGGGVSIAMWGGGNTTSMVSHSIDQGCELQSAWASAPDGTLVGYLAGAPDFVNERWYDVFPDGDVPAGQVLIVRCSPVEGSSSAAAATEDTAAITSATAPVLTGDEPAPAISAEAAVVIDGGSGAVLHEQQAYTPLPPASLTKILTATMVIESADLDAWVYPDLHWRELGDSTLMGLLPGDCFTVRDLLYGLMLPSGNDAAVALARHIAGSEEAFVARMNERAQELGLASSAFTDPHGLGGPQHYMSAYDVAMLTRYAMTFPVFEELVGTSSYTTTQGSRGITVFNINSFLGTFFGADGVKTGYTEESGRTLAASAVRNGRRVIVVLLDAPERDTDAGALLDWAFSNFAWE